MRTSGAHYRRTHRKRFLKSAAGLCFLAKRFRNQVLGEFSADGKDILALDLQSERLAVVLHDRIQLFHHDQTVNLRRKVQDQLIRKRIGHTDLQDGYGITEDFRHILIAGGGSDDAKLCSAHLHTIHPGSLGVFFQKACAFLHDGMSLLRVARHHDILGDVLLVGLHRYGAV